ncbi:FAD/NAD(P)-binding domain-containing protein [Lophium mytilinum]|uniref:FAD/NAD(P)-binding domain-containing protein n=1 Tax=Lophium mytilinum TaxID=390894 RepID=A0A6A6R645_9PEZI|nr:FAD/NAD(P)-binding domain-containing protein [Lophium mytilinum]
MSFLLQTKPIFEPKRTLKVIVIGAGASGLLTAYKLQRHFDNFELNVYEKNSEASGTWFENRYPGCACDVPSHCYTWSFEPKTDWSATYASSTEIHQYFNDFMHKYGLQKYVKLQHAVSNAVWNEKTAQWDVTIDDLATGKQIHNSAHVVINAAGILNAWRYPPIPGIKEYKGALVHSAAWDPTIELKGKTVGLIGNGSSGIQILPAIKGEVKELITFIREPTWVAPPIGQGYKAYSVEERAKFATDPAFHLQTRKEIEQGMNSAFAIFHAGSEMQKMTRQHMLNEMQTKLNNKELEKLLIPEWSVGCRRLTPGTNYLESLSDPNVKVVYGEIEKITEKGPIVDDGNEYPVDVLICATGFDTTFKPRFPLIGPKGKALAEVWKDEPQGYLGIAVNDYPNYFMTLGPNCPIGNGPVLISIESEVDYIIKMLSKFQKENIRSFDVKPEPVQEFNDWKEHFMSGTIWTEECRSWYKSGNIHGKIAALWPGSTLHYLEALKEPRWEDWNFEYESKNRFEYLGNGHSSAEVREGGDLSYYIRNHDDDQIDIVLKKPGNAHPELEGIVPSPDAVKAKL